VSIAPGTYVLGPDSGTLTVLTGKGGAAAKAGHNLRMEVGRWQATLAVGAEPSLSLSADARSLRVVEGTGGMMPLGDEEKTAIPQTIDEDVLKGTAIEFRSTRIAANGSTLSVEGELELWGSRRPVAFELTAGDGGRFAGSARIRHSDWGVKPYSALFGTLKVTDEVDIAVDATARRSDDG
jgi:hypothetical protein